MKILHFSDTHIWLNIENTTREQDFYNNFEKVIDEAILEKPDLVVHSWDLFHTSKPTNKAISCVVSNFLKLSKHNIPLVIIAWNHDTPRLSTTTHAFEIFKNIENIYISYEPKIDNFEINWFNIVTLPHIHNENLFNEKLWTINDFLKTDKKNIFVSHFGFSAKDYEEFTDEISWVNIPVSVLSDMQKFDYVALGHYHKHFILKNASYSWSIEKTSFNWKDNKIWYSIVEFQDKIKITHKLLPTRSMIDYGEFDCDKIDDFDNFLDVLWEKINLEEIKNSIFKISFININTKLMMSFNDNKISQFFENVFYLEYKKLKTQKSGEKINIKISEKNFIYKNFKEFYKNFSKKNNLEYSQDLENNILEKLKNL